MRRRVCRETCRCFVITILLSHLLSYLYFLSTTQTFSLGHHWRKFVTILSSQCIRFQAPSRPHVQSVHPSGPRMSLESSMPSSPRVLLTFLLLPTTRRLLATPMPRREEHSTFMMRSMNKVRNASLRAILLHHHPLSHGQSLLATHQ